MSEFAASLSEVFERMGRVQLKRMFGGQGVYLDGRMFGLVARDTLYLKTDAQTAPFFDTRELPPFSFERQGKVMRTSYRAAPEEIFEDKEEAALWGNRAFEAALRSGAKAPPQKKKRATRAR